MVALKVVLVQFQLTSGVYSPATYSMLGLRLIIVDVSGNFI